MVGRIIRLPLLLARRVTARDHGTRLYPAAVALSALMLGLAGPHGTGIAVLSASAIGSLFVLHQPAIALIVAFGLAGGLFAIPGAPSSPTYWANITLIVLAASIPRRLAPALLQLPRWAWLVALVLGSGLILLGFLQGGIIKDCTAVAACLCAALIGAGITRHLAVTDARLLAWGDGGLVPVTRDLLLGRITSGMLHDLAQPLNVISMANGNMDYIISHLDIDEENRKQLRDRVRRIATHTEGTAHILSLFRWFGRDGRDGRAGELTVRGALECALAATKSNLRHHGVDVHLRGNGLDHQIPEQYGALEIMAVAALLSAFGSYLGPNGEKHTGAIVLYAVLSPMHVVITVECTDAQEKPMPARRMDEATLWLVEQVAKGAASDFRFMTRNRQPVRFTIRLARHDV